MIILDGKKVSEKMWEPFMTDVSEYINMGENEIELTLTNNLRNMQGPFHLEQGESYRVCPDAFYKEKCVWKYNSAEWNDEYCFVEFSIENRE